MSFEFQSELYNFLDENFTFFTLPAGKNIT